MTPTTETKSIVKILTKNVFDLATFDNVKVGIEFTPTPALSTMQDALAYLGNDESKIVAAINKLKVEGEEKAALDQPISAFHSFVDDEDESKGLNGPANVVEAHEDTVNTAVLNIAKQVYGYQRGLGSEHNKAARQKAIDYIRANPAVKDGLAALSAIMLAPKG